MKEPTPEPKIIKLPRNGPKPGQSQNSYLYGRSFGDRQWAKRREANFGAVMQRRQRFSQQDKTGPSEDKA